MVKKYFFLVAVLFMAMVLTWFPDFPNCLNRFAVLLRFNPQQHSSSDGGSGRCVFNANKMSGAGVFRDFAAFKAARLRLPEKQESFRPAALEEALFPRGLGPGEVYQRYGGAGHFRYKRQWFCPGANAVYGHPAGLLNEYRLVQNRRCDLDGDGTLEIFTLRDGIVTVYAGAGFRPCLIWQSPANWWVDYFFLGDIDNDGVPELNLSVWKEGSFGPRRPFWLKDHDDAGVKNHLFIFKLAKGHFKPVWQSSNLDCPNYWSVLADLDGDGENELVVLEGSYTNPRQREVTLWKWRGWGFSRINY